MRGQAAPHQNPPKQKLMGRPGMTKGLMSLGLVRRQQAAAFPAQPIDIPLRPWRKPKVDIIFTDGVGRHGRAPRGAPG